MRILQSSIRATVVICIVLLLAPWSCNPVVLETKPNVIIVLTDDQGYGDLSCHGNPVLKTPSLDQLSAESVRFTDFHVSAMCTPSRGQILTGIDAFRNGATCVSRGRSLIQPGIPTLADLFSEMRIELRFTGNGIWVITIRTGRRTGVFRSLFIIRPGASPRSRITGQMITSTILICIMEYMKNMRAIVPMYGLMSQ